MGARNLKTLNALGGRQGVVIDTMVLIYLFEEHPRYVDLCEQIMDHIFKGIFTGVVTPITAAEVLVNPLKQTHIAIADRYRRALGSILNLKLFQFDMHAGFIAGALRARYGFPLPDMFQVAAAMSQPAKTFITNDKALRQVNEVDVFLIDEMMGS